MEKITSGSIRFTADSIQEFDGNQVIVSIPRQDITSISLCYGESVEKPILQFVGGIIMCALGAVIGVWPTLGIIFNHETVGTPIILKGFAFAAPLIFIGVVVIIPIFRKSHFLLVKTKSVQRKLPIKCSPAEIVNIAQTAGYQIIENVS